MHTDPILVTSAVAVVAGIISQAIARRLRLPAILPLLLSGMLLGPSVLGVIDPASLGEGLRVLIGFAVAIILFEGGLSLKADSFRNAGATIRNLVTFGALLTWGVSALIARWLFPELGWGLSLLFGSLIIVTGPTVIQPLLASVRPRQRVSDVLRGEAILVDPVGALYAVLVLEYLVEAESIGKGAVFGEFGLRLALGGGLGLLAAGFLYLLMKRRSVLARDLHNLAVVAIAIGAYALSELLISESGVLTVTIAGFILGWLHPPGIEKVEEFKSQLTTMMVSIIFVLLSANVALAGLVGLGWNGLWLVLAVIFIVRPLVIFVSTLGGDLTLAERLFLAWIAPRGIIAAAVSSLFALILSQGGEPLGELVLYLVFAVVVGTVLVQAPTARWVAARLGVLEGDRNGFLFVGGNTIARALARALDRAGYAVQIVDRSQWQVDRARAEGLHARCADALDPLEIENFDLFGIGHLCAATPSDGVNRLAVQLYAREFGRENVRAIKLESSPPDDLSAGDPMYAFGSRLVWEDFLERLNAGQEIRSAEVDEDLAVDEIGRLLPGAVALLAIDEHERVRFLEDDDPLTVGEKLFYLTPGSDVESTGDSP
ncbi:MAG: cation:proton antiporter [bacterium]|nr:sodium:proton antiporter [Planctomycetota bacterium]HIL51877.1 sodium:proton antiporter [Planctomycetota bacterium]